MRPGVNLPTQRLFPGIPGQLGHQREPGVSVHSHTPPLVPLQLPSDGFPSVSNTCSRSICTFSGGVGICPIALSPSSFPSVSVATLRRWQFVLNCDKREGIHGLYLLSANRGWIQGQLNIIEYSLRHRKVNYNRTT